MFASLLPGLTLVALGAFVPAFAAALMLARGRHASASVGPDRWGRVAVAAAGVAAAGGVAGVLLGAGPASVAATAALLAAPVCAWAALAPWWPVRAVVAWAMLVTGSVGLVAMATGRALESSLPWSALPVAGVGSAVVVVALGRINGPFRRVLGIRAGIHRAVRAPLFLRPALLRPALTLAVFFAAMAVGGLTGVGPGPGGGDRPEASPPGSGPGTGDPADGSAAVFGSEVRPVSADTAAGSGSSQEEGSVGPVATDRPARAGAGAAGTTATSDSGSGSGSGTVSDSGASTPRSGTSTSGGSTGTADGGSGATSSPVPTGGDATPVAPPKDGSVTGTVEQVTEPVQTVVQGTVEPVQTVVQGTVEPVQTVVEETVNTVDQVTDPVTSVLP